MSVNGTFDEYEAQNAINFDNILGSDDNDNTILGAVTETPDEGKTAAVEQLAERIAGTTPTPQVVYMQKPKQKVREYKIGRNDPCPCGSGKKYKNCCLALGTYEGYVEK